jgi:hypothetical protein
VRPEKRHHIAPSPGSLHKHAEIGLMSGDKSLSHRQKTGVLRNSISAAYYGDEYSYVHISVKRENSKGRAIDEGLVPIIT